MTFNTSNSLGVNLGGIYAAVSTSTPEIPALPFKIGTHVLGNDGSEWIFATAGGVINQYEVVMIDSAFAALSIVGGSGAEANQKIVGFYQNSTALAATDSAWFMIRGKPTINVLGSCAKDVQLYTTNTSGALDDATTTGSQFPVFGVTLTTTIGGTASSNVAVAMFPTVGQKGQVIT